MKTKLAGLVLSISLLSVTGWSAPAQAGGPGSRLGSPQAGKVVCTVDDRGIIYDLVVGNGSISGSADHPDCGMYESVSGYYRGSKMEMHVSGNSLCSGYNMEGVLNRSTRTIEGVWENDDDMGSSVVWSMQESNDDSPSDDEPGPDDGPDSGEDDGNGGDDQPGQSGTFVMVRCQ